MYNRKSATEDSMLTSLSAGKLQFPPLELTDVATRLTGASNGGKPEADALFTFSWQGRSYRFGVVTRRLWTPKVISDALEAARRSAAALGVNPLIQVPYLSDETIRLLEAKDVSGIDLCGNGVVIVPGELLVLRTGLPNQFRWQGTIKNVYRKNSSVVARCFLLVPEYNSVTEALQEIRRRGGEVTTATVSKVCKALEADLIIERSRGSVPVARRLRLLQPAKLLDLLAGNYVPPDVSRVFQGKCALQPQALRERLEQSEADNAVARVVLTGATSVDAYAVMAREPVQSFYCTDLDNVLTSLGSTVHETDRFANVVFQETRDSFVYFDRRPGLAASPIQSYLELVKGDKRDKETAEQVRRLILQQSAGAAATREQ